MPRFKPCLSSLSGELRCVRVTGHTGAFFGGASAISDYGANT